MGALHVHVTLALQTLLIGKEWEVQMAECQRVSRTLLPGSEGGTSLLPLNKEKSDSSSI